MRQRQQKQKIYDSHRYNISSILRKQNKSNDYFELMLANLSLEDLIALKMELVFKNVGVRLLGFPIYRGVLYVVQEALIKYALSATNNRSSSAAKILGMSAYSFYKLAAKYKINDFFSLEKGSEKHENSNN